MKIAVCGCSWSCRDINMPDIEFGKLISDYYNAEYINLAKPACSNSGIAMQVDYLIDQDIKPDLVIINATTVTRTELKLLNDKRFDPTKSWDNVDYNMLQGEKFRDEHAPGYGKGYDPTITIDSLSTIFGEDLNKKFGEGYFHERYKDVFSENSYEAFKKWFLYFFDADLERYKQHLILLGVCLKLQNNAIKFIFCPNTFDWAEDTFIDKQKAHTEYPDNPTPWLKYLKEENVLNSGISESLHLADEIYGSWDNSPGINCDNHLPVESHMDFCFKVISHINQHNMAK